MHPSLKDIFMLPEPLTPCERMPVNEVCWCGSGLKWKKCHRDRQRQETIPIWQLREEHRSAMSRGRCLHPLASKAVCGARIIRAHTVQRNGGLNAVAEGGHVISAKRGFEDISKNDGKIIPRQIGVKDASTFMGFCDVHDNELFAPIEKAPFDDSKLACFLLSFRAISYEVFHKESALRCLPIERQLDRGHTFELQCRIQGLIHARNEGLKRGMKEIIDWKNRYDSAYLNDGFGAFFSYGVRFSDAMPIVACGAFNPEFDFEGHPLQALGRGKAQLEVVCFNLTVVKGKSVVVFGWTGEPQGPAECFVESYKALSTCAKASAAFHVAVEYLENIYFLPSWWNAQPAVIKEYLVERFRTGVGLGGVERKPDSLLLRRHSLTAAEVEKELYT